MQTLELAPGYSASRVIRGNWQLAGGHGPVETAEATANLEAFAEAGITTFDCADIYTGVEDIIGRFRHAYAARHGAGALARVRVHTKFVPDLDALATITRRDVDTAIDASCQRLGMDRLDLVQLHWWDYDAPRYLEVAGWLDELRQAGKIAHVGGTNFDTARLTEMKAAGLSLFSLQVQYSLLDDRPARGLIAQAKAMGAAIFCYGTVAGGFLTDRWLGEPESAGPPENRSLVKYKLIIDEFGGWDLFQSLLRALRAVADRHGSDIATVASAAMLKREGVAAVIVGARNRSHLASNLAIAELPLDAADLAAIDAVLAQASAVPGDVYALERDRAGRHGAIMKYRLNSEAA